MSKESKKIKEEFGFESEELAVKEYSLLNRDFMYPNYPLIADEIVSKLNLNKSCILDIGTGVGSLAFEFAKRLTSSKVYGLDISQDMLKEAERLTTGKKPPNLEFILGDAYHLEFKDEFFDLVVSFGVLHHLKDLRLVFGEIKRVLKKEGSAFIYDLRKDAPADATAEIAQEMPAYPKRAFLESVREAQDLSYIEDILKNLRIQGYSLSSPEYSRQTIIKNKNLLRESKFLGKKFNEIMVQVYFRK